MKPASKCVYVDCGAPLNDNACPNCRRCQCGCGDAAPISKENRPSRGVWKGKILPCIKGHHLSLTQLTRPTRDTLFDLYHGRELDLAEIAELYDVSFTTAQRWLCQLDIPRRSLSSAQELNWLKNPQGYQEALRQAVDASVAYTKGRAFGTADGRRKSHITNEIRNKARRVTVTCKCGCGGIRLLCPSRVRPGGNFYSRSCVSRYYNHERKVNRIANRDPTAEHGSPPIPTGFAASV
ncbi:MAG: hypothetical protein JWL77_6598 [Chthonomonadaceae bacterium]|nr:hypothetical protein [Chthonomonadaceae bacterium]